MSVLIAYTTITIDTGDGNVEINIEALDSSLPPSGETKVRVTTDPIEYLSSVSVDLTDGSIRSEGIKTEQIKDEQITLTRTTNEEYAKGSLSQVPISNPSANVIASIGGSSGVTFNGKEATANSLSSDFLVVECDYSYKFKQYNYKAPSSDSVKVVGITAKLNV